MRPDRPRLHPRARPLLVARWNRRAGGGLLHRLRPGDLRLDRSRRDALEGQPAALRRLCAGCSARSAERAKPEAQREQKPARSPRPTGPSPSATRGSGSARPSSVAGPVANFLFAIVVSADPVRHHRPAIDLDRGQRRHARQRRRRGGHRAGRQDRRPQRPARVAASRTSPPWSCSASASPCMLKIERGGKTVELNATAADRGASDIFGDKHRIGQLGIQSTPSGGTIVHYDPATAVWMAVVETYRRSVGMLKAVGQIVDGIRPSNEVGGVLRIAKMSGDIASRSLVDVIDFAMLLSINLGLINLFPVRCWMAGGCSSMARSRARPAARPPGGGMGFARRARSGIEFDAVRHLERSRIAERHPVPQALLRVGGGEGVGELRDRLKALLLAAGLALGVVWRSWRPSPRRSPRTCSAAIPSPTSRSRARSVSRRTRCARICSSTPGDPFAADRIDKALKNLFATGLFADVTFRREGNTLIVKVVENPIINTIAFEGNDYPRSPRTSSTKSRKSPARC